MTADSLTVDGIVEISSTTPTLRFFETDQTDEGTILRSAGDSFQITKMLDTGAADGIRFGIDQSSGDISFYEDTGTTAKLTWDASAESLNFADDGKAIFGAGSDLQIYHDSSVPKSVISEQGGGPLELRTSQLNMTTEDGSSDILRANATSVKLYGNNAVVLNATSTGIDVTGTVVTDGLTVAGNVSVDGGTIKLDGNYPVGTAMLRWVMPLVMPCLQEATT